MKNLKIVISLVIMYVISMFLVSSVSAATGNAYIHYYHQPGYIDRTPTYTNSKPHLSNMGYTVYGYDHAGTYNALNQLNSGVIFVVHNHGAPGIQYMGTGNEGISAANGTNLVNVNASTLPFFNTKLAILYGCNTGTVTSLSGDLPQSIVNKGAKVAVAWTVNTNITAVNEWNRLFFEKAATGASVVESFRHADYWTAAILGTSYSDPLQYNRVEKGNINISIN